MLRCGMHRGTDPSLPPRVNHPAPARPPRLPPSRVAPRAAVGRSFLTRAAAGRASTFVASFTIDAPQMREPGVAYHNTGRAPAR